MTNLRDPLCAQVLGQQVSLVSRDQDGVVPHDLGQVEEEGAVKIEEIDKVDYQTLAIPEGAY